jgi:cytochrome c
MMRYWQKLLWILGVTAVFLSLFSPSITAQEEPTPTVDRLAAPPTVPSPNQADEGAQLYWLYCQPCHGDRGQGLTDEWRSQFPEEEQNCWQSGCHGTHGKDKPEFGFVLPTTVPPLTTKDSLPNYDTMGQFYYYIRAAMPLELPGRLTTEEYLAITAHIAREHSIWDGETLTEESVLNVWLRPENKPTTTPAPLVDSNAAREESSSFQFPFIVFGGVGVLFFAIGGVWFWRRQLEV